MTALINVHDGKKKKSKKKGGGAVTMSSSHSGLLKDSLDRLVHLKDIKHCCRPHSSLLDFFFLGFLFYLFLNSADFPFFCKDRKKGMKKKKMKTESEREGLKGVK